MLAIEWDFLGLMFFVALAGFFSSAETAFLSMNKVRIKRLVDSGVPGAVLLHKLKQNQQKTLITILIANNISNFSAASFSAAIAFTFFPDYGVAISTALITFLILVFSEITPKSIALRHGPLIALNSAPVLYTLSIFFSPLIALLEHIASFFAKLFGAGLDEQALTEEEVKATVALSAEEGSILLEEKEMIHRIFLLNDITVSQVMTPLAHIIALREDSFIKDVPTAVLREHSRFPVFGRDIDDIRGIFYVRDYLGNSLGSGGKIMVGKLMQRPFFVYENKKLDKLLHDFRSKHVQMAIIVNAKGDTTGLITIEDILSEIVGEIKEK